MKCYASKWDNKIITNLTYNYKTLMRGSITHFSENEAQFVGLLLDGWVNTTQVMLIAINYNTATGQTWDLLTSAESISIFHQTQISSKSAFSIILWMKNACFKRMQGIKCLACWGYSKTICVHWFQYVGMLKVKLTLIAPKVAAHQLVSCTATIAKSLAVPYAIQLIVSIIEPRHVISNVAFWQV